MYCRNCGAKVDPGQGFCSACGSAIDLATRLAQASRGGRVMRHIQVIAVLWVIWSLFHVARGAVALAFGRFGFPFIPFHAMSPGFRLFLLPLISIFGIVILGYAIAGIIAAWGLFQRLRWARTLALLVAFLSLIEFPFGTALGIYTLWALLPADSAAEYNEMCPSV